MGKPQTLTVEEQHIDTTILESQLLLSTVSSEGENAHGLSPDIAYLASYFRETFTHVHKKKWTNMSILTLYLVVNK